MNYDPRVSGIRLWEEWHVAPETAGNLITMTVVNNYEKRRRNPKQTSEISE